MTIPFVRRLHPSRMDDKLKRALARGEAANRRRIEREQAEAASKREREREEAARLRAEYRTVADAWVESRLAKLVEEMTARGERSLDVATVVRDLRCTEEVMAEAMRAAGLRIDATDHEHCDYETGRGEGTYYQTYRASW